MKTKSLIIGVLLLVVSFSQVQAQTNPDTIPLPPPPPPHPSQVREAPKQDSQNFNEEKIFEKVQIEASVNIVQWRRHLEKNLLPYVMKASGKNIKPGVYTVNVKFLVELDGSVSNLVVLNDPGYSLGEGAMHIVKTGPKWIPGEINGKKVCSYHVQPITFQIQDK